jgi:hypothetical protein
MPDPTEPTAVSRAARAARFRPLRLCPRPAIALALAATLAACGDDPAPAPADRSEATSAAAPAALATTAASDWRRLGDGSFARTAQGVIADRREADRCWPAGDGFDCLSLDAIPYAPGAIVVASRTTPRAYAEVPVAPPAIGFNCAIYPGGVVEQRLLRAEGDWMQNDDTDGSLWSAADVARFNPPADGRPFRFVDCKALAARLGAAGVEALVASGFDRNWAMPPMR